MIVSIWCCFTHYSTVSNVVNDYIISWNVTQVLLLSIAKDELLIFLEVGKEALHTGLMGQGNPLPLLSCPQLLPPPFWSSLFFGETLNPKLLLMCRPAPLHGSLAATHQCVSVREWLCVMALLSVLFKSDAAGLSFVVLPSDGCSDLLKTATIFHILYVSLSSGQIVMHFTELISISKTMNSFDYNDHDLSSCTTVRKNLKCLRPTADRALSLVKHSVYFSLTFIL